MEIKAQLLKPYTDSQRIEFIVEQNHRNGYEIVETETSLDAMGYTEEEKKEQERKALDELTLTAADVERAIYNAKGMDFEDLVEFVKKYCEETGFTGFDIKRLKIELKANNFFRKHDYINMIGGFLGYTPEDMDFLFLNKEFPVKEEPIEEVEPEEEKEELIEE